MSPKRLFAQAAQLAASASERRRALDELRRRYQLLSRAVRTGIESLRANLDPSASEEVDTRVKVDDREVQEIRDWIKCMSPEELLDLASDQIASALNLGAGVALRENKLEKIRNRVLFGDADECEAATRDLQLFCFNEELARRIERVSNGARRRPR